MAGPPPLAQCKPCLCAVCGKNSFSTTKSAGRADPTASMLIKIATDKPSTETAAAVAGSHFGVMRDRNLKENMTEGAA